MCRRAAPPPPLLLLVPVLSLLLLLMPGRVGAADQLGAGGANLQDARRIRAVVVTASAPPRTPSHKRRLPHRLACVRATGAVFTARGLESHVVPVWHALTWHALTCQNPGAVRQVSTSRYYFNYRHTANALMIYDRLRRFGVGQGAELRGGVPCFSL